MSVGMAILFSVSIVIFTFILIIFYLCDDIIVGKLLSKISKKYQYIVSFVTILCILAYITLNLYKLIHNIFN